MFEVVAHRGAHAAAPENSLEAFERAVALGADAVELDVRLTRDRVPVVFHYFYLDEHTPLSGPIFEYAYAQLREAGCAIPTLPDVLQALGGRIGLEIEVKGPEPECVRIVGDALRGFRALWDAMEITSYEPALLQAMRAECPGLATDLLVPRTEAWMRADVVTYQAVQRGRLAGARAVHLHPTQLSAESCAAVRAAGMDVHAWDVNHDDALRQVTALGVPRLCTDAPEQALAFRRALPGRPRGVIIH